MFARQATFNRRRAVELKHGRIAMCSSCDSRCCLCWLVCLERSAKVCDHWLHSPGILSLARCVDSGCQCTVQRLVICCCVGFLSPSLGLKFSATQLHGWIAASM